MPVNDIIGAVAASLQITMQAAQMIFLHTRLNKLIDPTWLLKQARGFSFEFDQILIKYSGQVYDVFCQILNGTLLTPEVVSGLMARLYLLIGILIFFRIAITMIRYIVAPETFLDDKVGAGNLVKRVVIGCILIIAIPLIFSTANGLQSAILNDKVIEKIILPKYAYTELTNSNNKNTGEQVALMTFKGFFGWNSGVLPESYPNIYKAYSRVLLYDDIAGFDKNYIDKEDSGDYIIYYIPILSTLAVGYVLYMFIKFALEIALRSFKLAFLQIISPFVIVNYMLNPSNDESVRKWTRTTVSTYVVMFIRVITVWFIALMVYYLRYGIPEAEGGASSLLNTADPFVKAVVILGLFAFLKDLPKLLSEMLGLDLQENETINGLMQQGFNVVKGFAMGKVGAKFAKQQLAWNTATTIGSGALGAAGGMAESFAKHGRANMGKGFLGAGNVLAQSMAEHTSPLVSSYGHAVSTSMGSTIAGPIAHASGLAQSSYKQHEYRPGTETPPKRPPKKEPKPESETPPKNSPEKEPNIETVLAPKEDTKYSYSPDKSYNNSSIINVGADVSENIFNNNAISPDGKIDLSGTSNPIVQQIRTEVNNHLNNSGSSNINVTNDTVNRVIREVASDPSHVSKKEVEVITQKVYEQAYTNTVVSEVPNISDVTYNAPEASYRPVQSSDDNLRDKPLTPPTSNSNNITYQDQNPNNNGNLIDE